MKFIKILLLGILLSACQNQVEFESKNGKFEHPENGPVNPGPITEKVCDTQNIEIKKLMSLKPLDLVIIMDTSGSLSVNRRQALIDGIKSYIAALPLGTDLNLTVLPAIYEVEQLALNKGIKNFVIKMSEVGDLSNSANLNYFNQKMDQIFSLVYKSGTSFTDGGEAGLLGFIQYTNTSVKQELQQEGIFREGADLSVIFASDENDLCSTEHYVYDNEQKEPVFREQVCNPGNWNEETIAENIMTTFKDRNVIMGSIVFMNTSDGNGGENERGYGYIELTELFDGILVDLKGSANEIAQGLSQIGERAGKIISYQTEYTVSVRPGFVAKSLLINGSDKPFIYLPDQSVIRINQESLIGVEQADFVSCEQTLVEY